MCWTFESVFFGSLRRFWLSFSQVYCMKIGVLEKLHGGSNPGPNPDCLGVAQIVYMWKIP